MKNIKDLNVSILHSHPNNPRKDLGDLTELAESIKQSGVMQNLTVVPHESIEGEYTVIIGHRRLGASKLAGLKTVPCVIVEMTEKEQLATMMLENMQRSDLTTYEQAQGFQLMIDFGESVDSISEKTGLSKTTVRNRVKLAKYDRDIMKEAATRQPTMAQYMKLCEIEDVKLANDVARFLGTPKFDYEVSKAIRLEKEKKDKAELMAFVESIAVKFDGSTYEAVQSKQLVSCKSLYTPLSEKVKEEALKLKEEYKTLYYTDGYGFTLFRKYIKGVDDKPSEIDVVRQKRSDLEQRAKAIYTALKERAAEFVDEYPGRKADLPFLHRELVIASSSPKWAASYKIKGVASALGWTCPDGVEIYEDRASIIAQMWVTDRYDENPAKVLLTMIFHCLECREPCSLYYRDTKLTRETSGGGWSHIFTVLEGVGYSLSDEERSFLDGTHPIYSEEVPL